MRNKTKVLKIEQVMLMLDKQSDEFTIGLLDNKENLYIIETEENLLLKIAIDICNHFGLSVAANCEECGELAEIQINEETVPHPHFKTIKIEEPDETVEE